MKNKNVISVLKTTDNYCCGCSCCVNECPKNAITLLENKKGFLEPSINFELCNDCGLCSKKCPILTFSKDKNSNNLKPKIYAYCANQDILEKSSSGGVFSALAEYVLNLGGVVVGAAYVESFRVEHIIIDKLEDLDRLRLSKYVQSDQKDCYKKTKELLNNDRYVLYSGTPCQIAGLKSYLGNKFYEKLILVDLLCHGVPPYKLLKEHLSNEYGLESVEKIQMRKLDGWSSSLDVFKKNGTSVCRTNKKSVFIHGFLRDMYLRDSCYVCKFASLPRQGDVTIGDLWNAKKLSLGEPFEKKCSIVLINNALGEKIWNGIDKGGSNYIDISNVPLSKLNKNIRLPNAHKTNLVDDFWRNLEKMSFEKATYSTLYPGKNVGLVCYASNNYGSLVTNFAIYKTIEALGYNPFFCDNLTTPWGISKDYITKNCKITSKFISKDDYTSVNNLCDYYVLGADYSLNIDTNYVKKNIQYLLMAFADIGKRKIAFAPSLGMPDFKNNHLLRELYRNLLNDFSYVSMREESAVDLCKEYLGIYADFVLDPVFLTDKSFYDDIVSNSSLSFSSKFMLIYMLDPTEQRINKIKELLNQEKYEKVFVILDIGKHEKNKSHFNDKQFTVLPPQSLEDYIYYFMHADKIFTDSFHGTCFSLIFKVPFISLKNRNRKRFDSLISLLKDSFDADLIPIFDSPLDIDVSKVSCISYNWEKISAEMEIKKQESYKKLQNALKSEKLSNGDNSTNMLLCQLFKSNLELQTKIKNDSLINSVESSTNVKETGNNSVNISVFWKFIYNKLSNDMQWSNLRPSIDFSKFFYKIFINEVNTKIHYELLYKNDVLYFCLHCELKDKTQFLDVFTEASQLMRVDLNNCKLNIPIDIDSIDDEIFYWLKKTRNIAERIISIEKGMK